jgi:hypothetical protein
MHGPFVFTDHCEKYFSALTLGGALHLAYSYGEEYITTETLLASREAFIPPMT